MKRVDRITAIVLLVFSVLVMFESSKMPLQVEFAPGYGFFPFWLGALMALLSVILYVQAWLRPAESDTPQPFPGRKALTAVVTMLVLLTLYAFTLEIVGYVIGTVVTVFAMLDPAREGAVEGRGRLQRGVHRRPVHYLPRRARDPAPDERAGILSRAAQGHSRIEAGSRLTSGRRYTRRL